MNNLVFNFTKCYNVLEINLDFELKGDIPLSDNHNKSKKMPGILAQLRKVVGLNIGTIMFGILFIYMAFSAILYFTTTHIESYQVTSGPLSRNETYTGLAIREETICQSPSS